MGTNSQRENTFRFKQFSVENSLAAMKVGTDGVLLGAWACADGCRTALDVGTGCGLIALMLAQRYQSLTVTAIDIVAEAIAEAERNFGASPWADRLTAVHADVNSFTPAGERFDLVVSNPPFYLTDTHSPDRARMTARHGLNLTPQSLTDICGKALLSPQGRLCMITPAEQAEEIEFRTALAGMHVARRTDVHTKATSPARRILWEIRPGGGTTQRDSLLIGSDAYVRLTSPFYLR